MDFWATWCPPCVQAMPEMQALMDKFAGKPVVVLGINQDAPGANEQVRKFLSDNSYTIGQVMDDGSIGNRYGVTGIPCVVIVDQKGVVRDVSVGYAPGNGEKLAKKIEALLDE